MSKFFEATGPTRDMLLAEWETWNESRRAASRFSRRMGASRTTIYTKSGRVVGLKFSKEPDPKIWKQLKGTSMGWTPRRNKAAREIGKEMRSFYLGSAGSVAHLLGVTTLKHTGMGFRMPGVGMTVVDGRVFLEFMDNDADDVNCKSDLKRISDVEYEQMVEVSDAI